MDELGRLGVVLFQGRVHMQANRANPPQAVVDLLEPVSSLEPRQQAQLCRTLLRELFRVAVDFQAFLVDMQHDELLRRFGHTDLKSLENALLVTLGPLELLRQLSAFKPQEVGEFVLSFLAQQPTHRRLKLARVNFRLWHPGEAAQDLSARSGYPKMQGHGYRHHASLQEHGCRAGERAYRSHRNSLHLDSE